GPPHAVEGFAMQRYSRRIVLLLTPLLGLWLLAISCKPSSTAPAAGDGQGDYLFCFWNVENFFDDRLDHRTGPGDKEYDGWVANNPDILKLKLDKLSEALLKLNDGRGPDI